MSFDGTYQAHWQRSISWNILNWSVSQLNFIKKKARAQVFSCKFCEIYKNIFFTKHLQATASKLGKLAAQPLAIAVNSKHKHKIQNNFFVKTFETFLMQSHLNIRKNDFQSYLIQFSQCVIKSKSAF